MTVTYGPATPAANVGGGTFDTATGIYTVPATGRYLIPPASAPRDNMTARSVGVGVHGTNDDGPASCGAQPEHHATCSHISASTPSPRAPAADLHLLRAAHLSLIAAALTIDRIG